MKKLSLFIVFTIIVQLGCTDNPTVVVPPDIKITFYPPSICPIQKFYIKGTNLKYYTKNGFAIQLNGINVNIIDINDTLITCSLDDTKIGLGDYEVSAVFDTKKIILGELYSYDSGWGRRQKLIVADAQLLSCIPAAAKVGSVVRIIGNCFGSAPSIMFGNVEGAIKQYIPAMYGYYLYSGTYSSYKKYNGYIDVEIPEGATTPIILKSECGDIDLTSNLSIIPFELYGAQVTLNNIKFIVKTTLPGGNITYDSSYVFNRVLTLSKTIVNYNSQLNQFTVVDSASYSQDYGLSYSIDSSNSYVFTLNETSDLCFGYKHGEGSFGGHTGSSQSISIYGSLSKMRKVIDTPQQIEYCLTGREIDDNLTEFQFRIFGVTRQSGKDYYMTTESIQMRPSDDSTKITLTVYKN